MGVGPVALKAFSPVTAARAASVLCSACAPSTGALMSRSAGRFNTLRRYVAADDVASSSSLPPIEYPELADVLKNEIKFEKKDFQVDEDLDKGPPGDWALQTEDGSITVTLMRKFKNETITVEFFAVDEEDEDAEEDDEFLDEDEEDFDADEVVEAKQDSGVDADAEDDMDDDELFDADEIDTMEFVITITKDSDDDSEMQQLLQFGCEC